MRLACLIALLLFAPMVWAGPVVAIAALAGAGAGFTAVALGTAPFWTAFFINFGVTLVLSYVAQALAPEQDGRGLGIGGGSQTVTVRQPDAPRDIILGQVRRGGTITYIQVTDDRESLHLVITFAGHQIEEFSEIWFNDEVLTLDGNGNAQGQYLIQDKTNEVYAANVPGSPYQITVPHAVDKVLGVYQYTGTTTQPSQLLDVSPSAPANASQYSRSGQTFTFHASLTGKAMRINYQYISATRSLARILTRLGTEEQTAYPELIAESGGKWTANHRQRGCANLYARLKKSDTFKLGNPGWTQTKYGFVNTGIPNITAVMKGARAYDPRSGLTAWTQNPALLLAWYLTLPKAQGGVGVDYATGISESHLIAAANICDEAVALAAGGTEPRYQMNGGFSVDTAPETVIPALLSSMAGKVTRVGATWRIYAGAYITPTETLDESECRAPMRIQSRVSRRELFNGVKGTFLSPDNNWQTSDLPPVTNATYLAEDGGERLWRDIELSFTTSASMGQRLEKIELERARQQITVDYPGMLSVFRVQPPDVIGLSNSRMGWNAKPFEVVRGAFTIYDDDNGAPALGYDLTLRETASTVWDWNSGEETTVDPAPDTDLPGPFDTPVPGLPMVAEQLYETTGSAGVKSRVIVTLAADAPLAVVGYVLEYKSALVSSWTVVPISRDPVIYLDDIEPGWYDFRARSIGEYGALSAYSEVRTQQILGLTADPADVTGMSVAVVSGQAWVTIDQHPDLDVRQGGRILLRWTPKTVGAVWEDGTLLKDDGWPGDSVLMVAPLPGTGTILAKARDSTGHISASPASAVVTQALLDGYTTVATVTEDPAFDGVKVSVAAVDGFLQLVGATLWDDLGLIDGVSFIDSLGGIVPSGTYSFASKIDLGTAQTVRLFPTIRTFAFDTSDLWDDRTDLIDSWASIDGDAVNDAEADLFVRYTNDDPNAAPVWSAWQPLIGAQDFNARGFDFKVEFTSANVTHNRRIEQLSVAARQFA